MDLMLTDEEKRLRDEFIAFFSKEMENVPDNYFRESDVYVSDENWEFHLQMSRKLGEKGWLSQTWPEEYGGFNASPVVKMLFEETASYYLAPGVDIIGVRMIGPLIYLLGTDQQKKEHLKPIARGERFWCQGWSEPDAGSDLAALTTTGIRNGDHYIVNGQKVWTSGAHRADWIFLLVRSDPESRRSKGLTFLIADMKTPGIKVAGIKGIEGHVHFAEVFLDNVKIPVENRIGDEHEGWSVTRIMSNFERSASFPMGQVERVLEILTDYCRETKRYGDYLINDAVIKEKLAQFAVEVEVGKALTAQLVGFHGKDDFVESVTASSAAKVFNTELFDRIILEGIQIFGPLGQLKHGSKWAPLRGMFEYAYQVVPSTKIAGGSSEIQRNLIAWTALGLPRK